MTSTSLLFASALLTLALALFGVMGAVSTLGRSSGVSKGVLCVVALAFLILAGVCARVVYTIFSNSSL